MAKDKEIITQDLAFALPEGLQNLIKNHVKLINENQAYINALVSGFLADKSVPDGCGVDLSEDLNRIIIKEKGPLTLPS